MTAKQKVNQLRFKKVVAEAKKLRSKNPKLTQAQAVKQAWAIFKKTGKVGENNKDTKSHNVNIRVVSGWRKGGTAIIENNEEKYPKLKNVRVRRVPKKDLFEKPGTFKKFTTLSGLFDTSIISDIDSLKKEYFKLAKKYHPDMGGTTAQMQQLVSEYDSLLKKLLQGSSLSSEQKANELQLDEAMRNVIDQLIGLEGLDVQIVGKWIWIGGQTYPVRNELKKAGLIFIKKNNVPYWVYKGVESRGKGNLTIEEIKSKYGAKKVDLPGGLKKLSGTGINKTKLVTNLNRLTRSLNKRPV
jgi:hypothetical protein